MSQGVNTCIALIALIGGCASPVEPRAKNEPRAPEDEVTRTGEKTASETDSAPLPGPESCAPATPENILERKGDYYRCVDTTLVAGAGCGTEGYPLGFGAKYADRSFDVTYDKLSPAGQDFFRAVSPCLQKELAVQLSASTACKEVWDDGFATHAGCYVASGFCDLPIGDWFIIGAMFDGAVYKLDEFASQLNDVAAGCAAL